MKIKVKDINEIPVKLGDRVEVLKITDESGSATSLYGVEPHLDGWVSIFYIEPFEGVVTFCEEKLMVVIRDGKKEVPLSNSIRYESSLNIFECLSEEDIQEVVKDYNLEGDDLEDIIDYLVIKQHGQ